MNTMHTKSDKKPAVKVEKTQRQIEHERLHNDGKMSVDQTVTVCAWCEGYEVTLAINSLDNDEGSFPHKIEYSIYPNRELGIKEEKGEFSLMHEDMLRFRDAINRAIEFFETENGSTAENATVSASPSSDEMVIIPRQVAENGASIALNGLEFGYGSLFDAGDIKGSIRRILLQSLADDEKDNEFFAMAENAFNFRACMRALGKGEGLPDPMEFVPDNKKAEFVDFMKEANVPATDTASLPRERAVGAAKDAEMVSVPREAVERAAKVELEYIECATTCVFDKNDIPISICRGLSYLYNKAKSGDDRDLSETVESASNYRVLMKALGEGDDLPDPVMFVNSLKSQDSGKSKKGASAK